MTDDLEHTTIEPPEPSASYAPYEPAAEAAPASAVVGPEARSQASRSRWAIALGVVAVGALPDPSALSGSDPGALGDIRCLFLVSVKDATAAKAWIDSVVTETGMTTSSESYGGATLTLLSTEGGQQVAYAILDTKVAVIG